MDFANYARSYIKLKKNPKFQEPSGGREKKNPTKEKHCC
jgi:hypothetical protein